MLYKFKSAATGDLIMLGAHGDPLLRLLGREPSSRGIIESADMPAAIAALEAAIAREADARDGASCASQDEEDAGLPAVTLRQRLWPMVDMLRRAHQADTPVIWGV